MKECMKNIAILDSVIDKLSLKLAWVKKQRLPIKHGEKYFQQFPCKVVLLLVRG